GHVPDLDLLVTARRSQSPAVGTESDAHERAGVSAQSANQLAAGRVPNHDVAFVTAKRAATRGQELAVGAEGHAVASGWMAQGQVLRAGSRVPHEKGSVLVRSQTAASHRDATAVGTERQAICIGPRDDPTELGATRGVPYRQGCESFGRIGLPFDPSE